jgi:hypothetical protein
MSIAPTIGQKAITPARLRNATQVGFFFGPARRFCRLASCAIWARCSADNSGNINRSSVLPSARRHRRKNANENVPREILLLIDLAGSGGPNASIRWDSRLLDTPLRASIERRTDVASRCQCAVLVFFTEVMWHSVAKDLFVGVCVLIIQDIASYLRISPDRWPNVDSRPYRQELITQEPRSCE